LKRSLSRLLLLCLAYNYSEPAPSGPGLCAALSGGDGCADRSGEIPRDKRVISYCRTSLRAWEAIRILYGQGFGNIEILDGGFLAWPYETQQGES
jgi:rhodanese-related sulfurtransferase